MPTILDTLSIAQCVVSYGKEASFAGTLANVAITVTPKALGVNQLRLVWAATGDIFSSFTDSTVGGSGTPGIIVLPQTGQDGFRHGTSTFKDWYYEAVVTATTGDGQQLSRTYRFQIPAGTTTLDLDMLDEDGVVTAMPAVAPVPTVTSVNGQTGAVTIDGSGTDLSTLPAASTIAGTDTVPLLQAGATKAATIQQLLDLLTAGAPGNLDTFFEVATQMGLDEATVTTLQALVAGKAPALTTAATKTAAYTAGVNEIVPVDATAGPVTVTFPTSPADKTRVIVKKLDASANAVALALGGSDVFNKAGGSTTGSLSLLNQSITAQYASSSGVWTVVGDDLPLSQLDGRYTTPASVAATYLTLPGGGVATGAVPTKQADGTIAYAVPSGAVASVAGRTGAVTLVKADVGLGNVDNTSDLNKPISTAQATVNAAKADLVGGLVPTSQIPALALNTAVTVASQAAMLALTTTQVQPGDLAIRSDGAGTFILAAADPSQLANWTRLNVPTDVVQTVNGKQGAVVLGPSDVGADPAGAAAAITLAGLGGLSTTAAAATYVTQTALAAATTVLPTVGLPSASAGANGDYALDATSSTTTITLYGPKTAGAWPSTPVATWNTSAQTSALIAAANGSLLGVRSVSSATTAGQTDSLILCNTTSAGFSVTLPTAVGIQGKVYWIKNTGTTAANTLSLATTSAQTIDGSALGPVLTTQYNSLAVVSDGANWQTIAQELPSGQSASLIRRTGAAAETFSRSGATIGNVAILTSGQMYFVAIPLLKGTVVSKITFLSGTTALASGSNQWFGLWNGAGSSLLGVTNDDGATAWGAGAEKTLTLASPYTVPADGLFLLSIMVTATTPPSLEGVSGNTAANTLSPLLAAKDTVHVGLTTPASAPASATLSGFQVQPWAWVG